MTEDARKKREAARKGAHTRANQRRALEQWNAYLDALDERDDLFDELSKRSPKKVVKITPEAYPPQDQT